MRKRYLQPCAEAIELELLQHICKTSGSKGNINTVALDGFSGDAPKRVGGMYF